MSNAKFERDMAALEAVRSGAVDAATVPALAKALTNKSNYLVAKAAKIAREHGLNQLIPDLLTALKCFYQDPVKTDPQCWAKAAIVEALCELGHDDPAPFLRGLRYVQLEGVWGGSQDTAGGMRAQSALGLSQCRSISDLVVLSHLLELLADPEKMVRVEAARAVGRIERTEAALLLRLRALVGDAEPEVVGACLSAVLAIEGGAAIGFVTRMLEQGGPAAEEAALALGAMHDARALQVLIEHSAREVDPGVKGTVLTAIALSRLPEGIAFLLDAIEGGSSGALDALATVRPDEGLQDRIRAAVEGNGSAGLRRAFAKHFG